MTTAREDRFLGNGNSWTGEDHRHRGWKLTCPSCGDIKIVTTHKQNSLPPSVILKKFTAAGWNVGRRESEDRCPRCLHKSREVRRAPASALQLPLPMTAPEYTPATPPPRLTKKRAPAWCVTLDAFEVSIRAGLEDLRVGRLRDVKNGLTGSLRYIEIIKSHFQEKERQLEQQQQRKARAAKRQAVKQKPHDTDYEKWLASLPSPSSKQQNGSAT